MGSKKRIVKNILPVMLKERDSMPWVEPFVGGANVISNVRGERVGSDIHKYLIALLKAIQRGWIPPDKVSRDEFYIIRNNKDKYEDHLVGFIGFCCTFGGKWWGCYAKMHETSHRNYRNYTLINRNSLLKQSKYLKGVKFLCCDYRKLKIENKSLIYCDPPYKGVARYKDKIDHDIFWRWCRDKTKEGHKVFISEYEAPEDFECVLEVPLKITIANVSGVKPKVKIERLFRYSG